MSGTELLALIAAILILLLIFLMFIVVTFVIPRINHRPKKRRLSRHERQAALKAAAQRHDYGPQYPGNRRY